MGKILNNKVAVITGAGKGIGKRIALECINEGAHICLIDIDKEALYEVKEEIENNFKNKRQIKLFKENVLNKKKISQIFESIVNEFGQVDILVNNIGGSSNLNSDFEKISTDQFDKTIERNLKSNFICTQAAIKYMKEKEYGRIINIASMAGRCGSFFGGAEYSASKGGVISLTRHLAKEFGGYNITINSIAAGVIYSGERIQKRWEEADSDEKAKLLSDIPLKRLGKMDEVANCVVFLASDKSSYITGSTLDVNGGAYVG